MMTSAEFISPSWLTICVLAPLVGAIINGLILRSRSAMLSGSIATIAMLVSFVCAVMAYLNYGDRFIVETLFPWIQLGKIKVDFAFEYHAISKIMLWVITGIGTMIHVYATSYMSHDKTPFRFFSYLNLFVFAMLVLLLSNNLLGVFMGWEGVGLCSYLLIGYWYQDKKNAAAGMKAFITNRIGDLGFVLALLLLVTYFGELSFSGIIAKHEQIATSLPVWLIPLICFGLFWASTGKSAQMPLYVWLPDAMAGPTPVSALIHAATMVTSGVIVTVKLWPLFVASPLILSIIFWTGLATALLAAFIAIRQNDLKKVLAYSTVSQLGFMFVALGAGAPDAALFHVVTHACFKALLFLAAGSVIHGVHDEKNMAFMGGLRVPMKVTHVCFLMGTLAIIGFPFFSGFFSKDMIIAKALDFNFYGGILLVLAAFLTAYYMLRAYSLTFWGKARSDDSKSAHESSWGMLLPLCVLAVLSVFIGWLETPHILGSIHIFSDLVKSSWYGLDSYGEMKTHTISYELILVALVTGLSLVVAFISWKKNQHLSSDEINDQRGILKNICFNKFYVDEIYSVSFIKSLKALSFLYDLFDRFIIDGLLKLFRPILSLFGIVGNLLHTGNVQSYSWYIVFAVILYFALGIFGL